MGVATRGGRGGRRTLVRLGLVGLVFGASCSSSRGDPAPVVPRAFYVSCTGNDATNGTSAASPWATLSRANKHRFHPGDQVLLQRGCVWTGTLRPTGSGTSDHSITVSAYGSGPLPRLIGSDASALVLRNVSGWTVENLDLTQVNQQPDALDSGNERGKDATPNPDFQRKPVVDVRALGPPGAVDCGASCTIRYISLQNLVVHDGQWDGIYVGGGYTDSDAKVAGNVDHLSIQDVESRGNAGAGVDIAGTYGKTVHYELTSVRVLDSYLHDNGGDGVVMGQVDKGLIQGNRCAYNGRVRNARVGCWAWDSKDVTIQYNEADHNMTPLSDHTASDGGGLDLDVGTVDSIMQYNWTHDNEGEGYLIAGRSPSGGYSCCTTTNATVRYNVSERDGSKHGGGITLFGDVAKAWIYNNTVYNVASRSVQTEALGGTGGDLTTYTYADSGSPMADVENNVFITDGTSRAGADDTSLWSDGQGRLLFDHNIWYRVEGGLELHVGRSNITSWRGWQALGQDRHGSNRDPEVAGPFGGGPLAYQLRQGSPAIDGGARLTGAPAGMGSRDYFGTSTPRGGYDVGPAEFTGVYSTRQYPATPFVQTEVTPSLHVSSLTVPTEPAAPPRTFARGSVLTWQATVVDANGSPAPGVTVSTVLFTPSWDRIYVSAQATTDSTGIATFTHRSSANDRIGVYFISLVEVVPASTAVYYDSSGNNSWTSSLTLK